MPSIFIGTSGFSYSYWKGRFYPQELASSKWLNYYSSQFNTIELNTTYYRFPIVKNLKAAAAATGEDFRFSIKIHRLITHYRKMKDVRTKIREFMDLAREGLGHKLRCILYQLPATFTYSEERLNDIIESVEHSSENIIEFRHESWFKKRIVKALRDANLSICSVSFPGLPETNLLSTKLFYKRMHGVPKLFESSYTKKALKELAKNIPAAAEEVYIYFNNTMYEAGYTNARFLSGQLPKERLA
jgi:uncharacterized protein YecE (DUF72 family)